ncbi:MAG: sulfite exporter TauE/SafE family protein [Chloroflexi bacterium]|nr:sulfite exporter TauE/SafE family protein [Chloroflexota bacterium]OJW01819.1 MAG: hypothetical protein BGO39_28110 [Chloroflexi bacterium 54-19]
MASFFVALAIGLTTGLILALVGGGGSILTVPALLYLLGMSIGPATTTSLVVVGANAAFGAWRVYRRNGLSVLRVDYGVALGLSGLIGTQVGNWLNHTLPAQVTLLGFALLMLAVAIPMLRPPRLETKNAEISKPGANWLKVGLIGLGLGFLTGLFGVGGGFLIVPALTLLLGFPMRQASATSLLVIFINSLSALLGRWPLDGLDWGLLAALLVGGVTGTWLGGNLGHKLADKKLRQIFAWLVVIIGVYIAWQALK